MQLRNQPLHVLRRLARAATRVAQWSALASNASRRIELAAPSTSGRSKLNSQVILHFFLLESVVSLLLRTAARARLRSLLELSCLRVVFMSSSMQVAENSLLWLLSGWTSVPGRCDSSDLGDTSSTLGWLYYPADARRSEYHNSISASVGSASSELTRTVAMRCTNGIL